jgi:hypothetical protein
MPDSAEDTRPSSTCSLGGREGVALVPDVSALWKKTETCNIQ